MRLIEESADEKLLKVMIYSKNEHEFAIHKGIEVSQCSEMNRKING